MPNINLARQKAKYQRLYTELFRLVWSTTPEAPYDLPLGRALQHEMTNMEPTGSPGDRMKTEWGLEIGEQLYKEVLK